METNGARYNSKAISKKYNKILDPENSLAMNIMFGPGLFLASNLESPYDCANLHVSSLRKKISFLMTTGRISRGEPVFKCELSDFCTIA